MSQSKAKSKDLKKLLILSKVERDQIVRILFYVLFNMQPDLLSMALKDNVLFLNFPAEYTRL